jgi:uncharacterized SAM-binding protein YcdF (DUF218 family)
LTYAGVMKEHLEQEGLPAERVWAERRSLDTHENAVHSAEVLRARGVRRIVLVTHASHMLRAERCFRAQGLEVAPAPCEFHRPPGELRLADLLPGHAALAANEAVFHEWLGLAWYWARGWI